MNFRLRPTRYPAQPEPPEELIDALVDKILLPWLDLQAIQSQADGYCEPDEITFLHALTVGDAGFLAQCGIEPYE